jgi:hypothetical protein
MNAAFDQQTITTRTTRRKKPQHVCSVAILKV